MKSRRNFLKKIAVASATPFVLPRFSIGKPGISPNEKINVAYVGIGGIGKMTFDGISKEPEINNVASADINEKFQRKSRGKFFQDYREMFDKMGNDIDAVCVSTPDHSHYKITLDAMQLGKHVCVQKPLVHNIWQCRQLEKARKYYNVKTQMMNQGHATEHIRLLREWYETGVTGDVSRINVLTNAPRWWNEGDRGNSYFRMPPNGFPLSKENVPANINWDMWINQAKYVDYNHLYAPVSWRGFWDYGTGILGDWFCHTADAPVWILDLKDPIKVELVKIDKNFDGTQLVPNSSVVKWTFAKTDKHPQLELFWYEGANKPEIKPKDFDANFKYPRTGMYMLGDKCTLHHGMRPNLDIGVSNAEFFKEFRRNAPAKTLRRARKASLYCEWIDAIKGDIDECGSNFKYASQLTELALLGCLVQRFGGEINWDAQNMKAVGRPELDDYIKTPERKGWETKPIG